MNILVSFNSLQVWQEAINQSGECPRMPLVYPFSAAFHNRNHKIFAIDYSNAVNPNGSASPFEQIYQQNELLQALRNVDLALIWGSRGGFMILRQILLSCPRRRVLLGSYVWQLSTLPTLKRKIAGMGMRFLARFARAVIVMTDEQLSLAKQMLPSRIPVIRFVCGVDTGFYKTKSNYSDVPDIHRCCIDKLLAKPYAIMPGDQMRYDNDAIDLVKNSDIRLVRVFREAKTETWFNEQIQKHGLNDRLFVFKDIGHVFLRFLLQNASAYLGLVDSSWQPAGWTVACEALASGLPVVMYEGLVSRELIRMGAGENILRYVAKKDIKGLRSILENTISENTNPETAKQARDFAATNLDLEKTGEEFVRQVEMLTA